MDHDRDDPAVLEALKDEKNPAVRGYVAGLVRQVEAICESRGVRAADLGKQEALQKLTSSELSSVRKLVAKILEIRKGNLDIGSKREIVNGLDEQEAAAREMLQGAVDGMRTSQKLVEDTCRLFLRAGLPREARKFMLAGIDHAGPLLRVKIHLAMAREPGTTSQQAPAYLSAARGEINNIVDLPTRVNAILDWLDAWFSRADDAKVLDIASKLSNVKDGTFLPQAERIQVELKRRGLTDPEGNLEPAMSDAYQELESGSEFNERVERYLVLAETMRRLGEEASSPLSAAIAVLSDISGTRNRFTASRADLVESCVRAAARNGSFHLVENLHAKGWWIIKGTTGPPGRFAKDAALGCIDAGNFDKALEYMREGDDDRRKRERNKFEVAPVFIQALVDAGEIDRAWKVFEEFCDGDAWEKKKIILASIAKRASQGEDILDETKEAVREMKENPFQSEDDPVVYLSTASIATIGYTVAMRKRIAEYVSKP